MPPVDEKMCEERHGNLCKRLEEYNRDRQREYENLSASVREIKAILKGDGGDNPGLCGRVRENTIFVRKLSWVVAATVTAIIGAIVRVVFKFI